MWGKKHGGEEGGQGKKPNEYDLLQKTYYYYYYY